MTDPTATPAGADAPRDAPPAARWPRDLLVLGTWIFFLTLMTGAGSIYTSKLGLYLLAGCLAFGTVVLGLIAAIAGAVGRPGRWAHARSIDHRLLRGGLLLVLGGTLLGFATLVGAVLAMPSLGHY